MTNITEKTVPNVSVGADTEQPSQKCTVNIITESSANFNGFGKRNGYTHRSISNIGRVQVFFSKSRSVSSADLVSAFVD